MQIKHLLVMSSGDLLLQEVLKHFLCKPRINYRVSVPHSDVLTNKQAGVQFPARTIFFCSSKEMECIFPME